MLLKIESQQWLFWLQPHWHIFFSCLVVYFYFASSVLLRDISVPINSFLTVTCLPAQISQAADSGRCWSSLKCGLCRHAPGGYFYKTRQFAESRALTWLLRTCTEMSGQRRGGRLISAGPGRGHWPVTPKKPSHWSPSHSSEERVEKTLIGGDVSPTFVLEQEKPQYVFTDRFFLHFFIYPCQPRSAHGEQGWQKCHRMDVPLSLQLQPSLGEWNMNVHGGHWKLRTSRCSVSFVFYKMPADLTMLARADDQKGSLHSSGWTIGLPFLISWWICIDNLCLAILPLKCYRVILFGLWRVNFFFSNIPHLSLPKSILSVIKVNLILVV